LRLSQQYDEVSSAYGYNALSTGKQLLLEGSSASQIQSSARREACCHHLQEVTGQPDNITLNMDASSSSETSVTTNQWTGHFLEYMKFNLTFFRKKIDGLLQQ
jgi:hypothetical protein